MAWQKIAATNVFDGRNLLSDKVLVTTASGVVADLIPLTDAGSDVVFYEGLLSPGFVNCHCHLELSHLHGNVPEGTGLVDFVLKVMTSRAAAEDVLEAAIAQAESAMKAAGIVAVGDICNNASTLPQKQAGNLRYYNFVEASGWLPSVATARLQRAVAVHDAFRAGGQTSTAIVPHAPYSVSTELWQALQPFFRNKVVTIHNQEAAAEDEFFNTGTGDFLRLYKQLGIDNTHHVPSSKSSLASYFGQLLCASHVILVHNTFTRQADLNELQSLLTNERLATVPPTVFFCLCVNANRFIEQRLPPVNLFRKNGCTMVVGTDSLASNWSLSILDELKTIRDHFPHIPLAELLQWATLNGATALQMDEELGSFEKGKSPGVLLLDPEAMTLKKRIF